MKYTAGTLRGALFSMIQGMGETPERYARDPGRNFTRRRSLPLPTLVYLILTMDGKSIWKGMLGCFQKKVGTPSASAFVQQRQKLLPLAFAELFRRFTDFLHPQKRFKGYRLLAVDGSSLKSVSYPKDTDAYRPGTERQHGWNLHHINALFDLANGIYTDLLVQKEHTKNESGALREMIKRSGISGPAILLADRNYEAYNNFACLEQKGWKYLIRLRDSGRKYAYGVTLPELPQFDLPVCLTLGRLTLQQLEQRGIPVPEHYYRIPPNANFEPLELESDCFYTFKARIVRLQLDNGNTETLLTNLDPKEFPLRELINLYAMRWGIETSFRQLKYTVDLIHLHSKKPDLILQEIYAAFILFNFTRAASWGVDIQWGRSKFKRNINFSDAVYLCCEALRGKFSDVTNLLQRKLQPHRSARSSPRPIIMGNRISSMYVSAR